MTPISPQHQQTHAAPLGGNQHSVGAIAFGPIDNQGYDLNHGTEDYRKPLTNEQIQRIADEFTRTKNAQKLQDISKPAPKEIKAPIFGHGTATALNYALLDDVLQRAYDQAAVGKGSERHGNGKAFEEQPMQDLCRLYGTGFALGQAAKKMQEAQRMDTAAAVRELLGAIVYAAGTIIYMESQ